MDRGQRRVKGYMADMESSTQEVENKLLDRILAAESVVVALRCDDTAAVTNALRRIAQRTGKAMFVWRRHAGLWRLRGRDEAVPGVVHPADVLRFVERRPQFGVYFLDESPQGWGPELVALLRRITEIDPRQSRRLVLPGTLADLPPSVPARELAWGRPAVPPVRLRQGAWAWAQ
jgi:hypothetical protein